MNVTCPDCKKIIEFAPSHGKQFIRCDRCEITFQVIVYRGRSDTFVPSVEGKGARQAYVNPRSKKRGK